MTWSSAWSTSRHAKSSVNLLDLLDVSWTLCVSSPPFFSIRNYSKTFCLSQTFSPDSRWLITTSLDSVIRTFDIPTGRLIDAFRTTSVATSVSFSPTGDFLATSHVDSVGVFLWLVKKYAVLSLTSCSRNMNVTGPTVHNTQTCRTAA